MKTLKITGVIIGAVIITALGIDASDTMNGVRGTLFSQIASTQGTGRCPAGMVPIAGDPDDTCIDMYEAGVAETCPVRTPHNMIQTRENLETSSCSAVSKNDLQPWTNITRSQAEVACARAGKRLPSNEEWHRAALGTPDGASTPCNTSTGAMERTGTHETCISASGGYDMVGNVWEWINGDVESMMFEGVALPDSGYIASIDSSGVPRQSSTTPSVEFGADYVWTRADDALYGVLRGGFYNSETDAGVYAFHAGFPPTTPGVAVGFRCVQ